MDLTDNLGDGKIATHNGPGIMLSHTPSPRRPTTSLWNVDTFGPLPGKPLAKVLMRRAGQISSLEPHRFVVEAEV